MMKKTMNLNSAKSLSAGLFAFFISSHAFSFSQIKSEFELQLPRQFQQQMINNKWKTLMDRSFQGNWQFSDQQIVANKIPINIKNISLKLKSSLRKPELQSAATSVELSSQNLQAQIDLGEVTIDHIIERNVGGIIGRFRVQALCKNIVLSLPANKGLFSFVINPAVEEMKISTHLQDFALRWEKDAWQSNDFECAGAQGFTDLIKSEITNLTSDSEKFLTPHNALIRKNIENYLSAYQIDFTIPRVIALSRPDIKALLKVQRYEDLGEKGLSLRGQLQIDFLKVPGSEIIFLNLDGENEFNEKNPGTLRLPQDFIKNFATQAYAANTWVHRIPSKKIPGFAGLMNSRFYQYFIWPELMNFKSNSSFLFDLSSNKNGTLEGQDFNYQIKTKLQAKMWAPKGGQYKEFMDFEIPFSSKLQLKVDSQKLYMTFLNPTMGLQSNWSESYLTQYHPSRRFAASTIRDKIVGSLWGETITYRIPSLNLSEGLELKINKVQKNRAGSDLIFLLGL